MRIWECAPSACPDIPQDSLTAHGPLPEILRAHNWMSAGIRSTPSGWCRIPSPGRSAAHPSGYDRSWQLVRLRIAQTDRRFLGMSVDQQELLSGLRQTDSKIGTGGGFANAALLVAMAMICMFIDFTSFLILAVFWKRKKPPLQQKSEVTALSPEYEFLKNEKSTQ